MLSGEEGFFKNLHTVYAVAICRDEANNVGRPVRHKPVTFYRLGLLFIVTCFVAVIRAVCTGYGLCRSSDPDQHCLIVGSAYVPVGRMVERVTPKSRSLFTRSKHDEIMRSLKREVLQQTSAAADPGLLMEEDRASEGEYKSA